MNDQSTTEALWRDLLGGKHPVLRRNRRLYRLIPSSPRCKFCNVPFGPPGNFVARLQGRGPSTLNPRMCNVCERVAAQYPGGAEIRLSMIFADVRGSTTIAQRMSTAEYSRLINRFYVVGTKILLEAEALIDRFAGDAVVGFFIPGFVGKEYGLAAVRAGEQLLRATGHADPSGPWLPVGVGVHTGTAFMGAVGTGQKTDITALGDDVNIAARLGSLAGPGEVLISEATCIEAGLDIAALEQRQLELKGRNEQVTVRVLAVKPTHV